MKKYFAVSFKYAENVYCTNIAHAENVEAVNAHYAGYEWVNVRECDEYEMESALRKGMPIVDMEETTGNDMTEYSFIKNVMHSNHLNEYEKVYFIKRFLHGDYNHLTNDELYEIYY